MTSPYALFETDTDLETGKGVTIDYGPFSITLHRAGGGNRKYLSALQAKTMPYKRQVQSGTLDEAISNKIMAEVYAESIVTGWSNVTDRNGKKLPFTKENVVKLLLDLPELFLNIQEEAGRLANFRKAEIEADAKNSVKS